MPKAIGYITANYTTKSTSVLTESRPVASLPYLGRYRLVDFALSNMVNAKITSVGLVMPFNYRSLTDHVGAGKDWGLSRKKGGLFSLPGSAFGTTRSGARFLVRDMIANKAYFQRTTAEYVIMSSANFVYNMDYRDLIAAHEANDADITAVVQTAPGDAADVMSFATEEGRVTGIKHGTVAGNTAFIDLFVIGREKLLEILDWYTATDYLDLFEAIDGEWGRVNVQTYEFNGYCAPIFERNDYYDSNMDMLKQAVTDELFTPERPIRTKAHDNAPAKFETGSHVTNSRLSGSDRIYGTVTGSILGRSVTVESGAVVRNSVVMQNCVVKSGAVIENAIIDRNNFIPAGTELRGTTEDLLIMEKGDNE